MWGEKAWVSIWEFEGILNFNAQIRLKSVMIVRHNLISMKTAAVCVTADLFLLDSHMQKHPGCGSVHVSVPVELFHCVFIMKIDTLYRISLHSAKDVTWIETNSLLRSSAHKLKTCEKKAILFGPLQLLQFLPFSFGLYTL